jgi:hypothetical protein
MSESIDRGPVLLAIAREAIAERLGIARISPRADEWLARPAATFVTLRRERQLRGCIGSIDPRRALGEDVARNAQAAAFHDPRFEPLAAIEFEALAVEVSVLSPRSPVPAESEAQALERIRPGVDGITLEYEGLGATFLPQVWESLPDAREFLEALRRKAGLPAGFWRPGVRLTRYTVEKFTDERANA